MKPSIFRLALVLVLVLMALPGIADAQDTPVLGAIKIIEPNLFMVEVGADSARPVYDLTSFDAGETLSTDATGVALITWFYDGTESVLGQNGSVTLNAFTGSNTSAWEVNMTLNAGHLVAGVGGVAADVAEAGSFVVATPAFSVQLLRGQMEVMVGDDGASMVVVTQGRAEVMVEGADAITVDENQFYAGAAGLVETLSDDGVTPNLTGVCTATANTNLVVRMHASEVSQRVGGAPAGQLLWVRAGSEGGLWLQVYYQTDPNQPDLHNFGWVYGPATTMDDAACAGLMRTPLEAMINSGPGVENADVVGETEPIE